MSGLFASRSVGTTSNGPAPSSELMLQNDRTLANPPEDSISDMSFSSQADYLAVASWDKKVRIYEVSPQGDSQGRAMYEHQAPVLTAQWFQDGSKVVSGGCDNAVRAHDLQSSQTIQIGQHDAPVSSVRAVDVGSGSPVVASASWDKTLRYWDLRQQQAISTIQLPERAYSMDSQGKLLVVGTAERHICVIDLSNPGQIFKNTQSPLKWQTRVVACYPSGNGYAVTSIEGRCAIQYVDDAEQAKLGFSFKCHRDQATPPRNDNLIYSVNGVSFHPVYGTFCTAGSDGTVHFWDKDSRSRLKFSRPVGGTISSTAFNRNGTLFAYAVSYDWSKGYQFNTPNYPNMVKIHPTNDSETKQRPKK
ncbi:RNA export factor GLE2 [Sugiyamaella lignohabitans]|uniref:RNA export factor GLE2 n=1 Tax=Sugiyamaella lignohabitans TaxID=796027 RepID=A0A167EU78_9ASCO|nr:RNA export factor GLE2 [Sugiyamaella lignohabitans]ANB14461.1 RNA export factor GLE2 [Sugiyamaella lignohabitans]